MKRCPKGYRVKVKVDIVNSDAYQSMYLPQPVTAVIMVKLFYKNEEVGYVDAVVNKRGTWETHSWVDDDHRKKGFGVLLYEKVIDLVLSRKKKIRSSLWTSSDAARVWHSRRLNDKFNIVRRGGRYIVTGKRDQQVQQREQVSLKLPGFDVLLQWQKVRHG